MNHLWKKIDAKNTITQWYLTVESLSNKDFKISLENTKDQKKLKNNFMAIYNVWGVNSN